MDKSNMIFLGTILIIVLFSIGIVNASDIGVDTCYEIRSPVISSFSGTVITPENFSGFWYDLDDNIGSEILTISSIAGRNIQEEELVYSSSIVQVEYEADFASEDSSPTADTYPLISLFGEIYIPTSDVDAGELVNLLLDTGDKYTLRTVSPLELPNGYELTAKQIDVDGEKVWMELYKDGELIEDEVVDVSVGEATWDYDVDVGDQSEVIVFRCLITDVFQGQVDSLVVVEGLWLLDYEDILEVSSSDEFGELEVYSVSDSIVMANPSILTLTKGESINLAEGLKFKVADDVILRFYLMKECIESGTYQLRGSVATGSSAWTAHNFAGFMYDLDDNIGSESLTICDVGGRLIEAQFLRYNASIVQVEYEANFASEASSIYNDTYPVLGLFGEQYVSLSDTNPRELVNLVVDSNDNHVLRAGSALELSNGYELTAKQINVSRNLVWMELSKDGVFVEDEVIDVTAGETTWDYDADVGNQDDVIVSRVLVTEVSEDVEGSFVVLNGLYLIDYQNILSIEPGDEFGKLMVDTIWDAGIQMCNYGPITLSAGSTIELAPGLNLQVADDSELRYYPFVEIHNDQDLLEIESFSPSTSISGYESASRLFEISLNQMANITWFLDGVNVQLNSSCMDASYCTLPPTYGEHTVKVLASNENNSVIQEWEWLVQKDPVVVDDLEFRSSVISSLSDIVITPEDFSGFWYDLDDGIGSEVLTISSIEGRTIPEGALRYEPVIVQVEYEADFASEDSSPTGDTYPVIGVFGEKYIPTSDDDAGEIVKLLIDADDKYTLRVGSTLELAYGYELTATQIDVEGDKVNMELSKDGEFIEEEIIDLTMGEATWDYKVNVGNQDDVIVFRVLITDVFQGQIDSLVVVEGLWLLDYDNVLEIELADEFGKLEIDSVSDSIVMLNHEPLTMAMGDIVSLAEDLKFRVADDNDLHFYLTKECTESGTYNLRGDVATGSSVWTAQNFAGFMYDFNDDTSSESLSIPYLIGRVIDEDFLIYNTSIVQVEYEANFASEASPIYGDTYPTLGLFGDQYVSLSDTDSGELVKLLIDSNDNHILRIGSAFELSNGYELTAKQIDVEGDKVWLELSKDGVFVEDEVLDLTYGEATWDYDTDVGSQDDVIVSRVLVTEVSEDAEGSFVVINGLYLIDYEDILSIGSGDEFGKLEVDSVSNNIVMQNSGPIVLRADDVIELAPGLYLQVADASDLRYYPFVEYKIMEILPNNIPVATSISISPNPANEGESVSFAGSGADSDGTVTGYYWTSSIDGWLSDSASFNTSDLSVGTHTIYFQVQDDDRAWSDEISATITINELPNNNPTATMVSITPNVSVVGESISFSGEGNDSDGSIVAYNWRSSLDGQLSTNLSFSSSSLSAGEHTIYFKVQDNDGAWSDEVSENIIVDDGNPFVNIDVGFNSNISINNPVSIALNSSDMYPGATGFTMINSTGVVILTENVTDAIASGEYIFTWNATSQSGEILPSGEYFLNLTSTDAFGHSSSEAIILAVDNTAPTISIGDIAGSTTQGNLVYSNSDVVAEILASDDVNYLECILRSVSTSYSTSTDAEFIDGKWVATLNLSSLDEGKYELTVNANDAAKNTNSTVSDIQVVVDHTYPVFMSTTSKYNDTYRKVSVTASESIIGSPVLEVNSQQIDLTLESGKWIGYFPLGTDSLFIVNVTGSDLAGNIGDSTSMVHVETISYENGQCKFNSSGSGMSIVFNGTNGTTGSMILTESATPMVNLANGSIGLYFIDVELDEILAGNMSDAMITIPVDSLVLPDGMSKEDVSICYYNESAENWDACPTSIEIIDGVECWTTYVTHFSMYGVIASDMVIPVLENVTPVSGTAFAKGTTSVNIRFNYSDAQTGINVSSVVLEYDGSIVNDSSLEITASYASYTATNLSSGSHTASVTVADMAGNSVVFSTTFTIASDSVTSTGGSGGSSGGGTTGEKYENVLVKEVESIFVNKGSHVSYEFNEEGNSISSVEFDSLKNSGTISTIVEVLKSRSSFADLDAPGTIYQQMNIWVGKSGFVTSENVENLFVTFKVERSWLEENNLEASTVNLYRYADGSWKALPTSITEEDDDFVYFKSQTPGFSPFAIGSESVVTETIEDTQESVPDVIAEETTVADTETEPESSSFTGILVAFVAILVVAAVVMYKKRS